MNGAMLKYRAVRLICSVKIGWVIGKLIALAAFGCVIATFAMNASGGHPFRFEAPIEPRPETVPLPEPTSEQRKEYGPELPPDDLSPDDLPPDELSPDETSSELPPEPASKESLPAVPHDAETSAAGARTLTLVYFYSLPGCSAGPQVRGAIARGEFTDAGLDVQERPAPSWVTTCPTFHWQLPDGRWWKYPKAGSSEYSIQGMIAEFDRTVPGARLKATASRATGGSPITSSSPFDQIQKFAGPSGSFVFRPDSPIAAQLDDRTSIRYPSIQGRYTVRDGFVEMKLEPPLPSGEYRKWLRFGFQIQGAAGPENLTATAADIRIDTNRGPQRVTIQMEPEK